jgi:hypothetical protein
MAPIVFFLPRAETATDGNSTCGDHTMNQLTLNLEPLLPERFPSLRAYIAHRAALVNKAMKVQAADMDMAPSTLARKLNPAEGDTQRFNCDDLEAWIDSTGEAAAVIEYLAAKFMDTDEARRTRALGKLETLLVDLQTLASQVRSQAVPAPARKGRA